MPRGRVWRGGPAWGCGRDERGPRGTIRTAVPGGFPPGSVPRLMRHIEKYVEKRRWALRRHRSSQIRSDVWLEAARDAAGQDRKHRQRLQAIVLARRGESSAAAGAALGVTGRAVRRWVAKYNAGGAAALAERPRSGRPCSLDAAGRAWLADRL